MPQVAEIAFAASALCERTEMRAASHRNHAPAHEIFNRVAKRLARIARDEAELALRLLGAAIPKILRHFDTDRVDGRTTTDGFDGFGEQLIDAERDRPRRGQAQKRGLDAANPLESLKKCGDGEIFGVEQVALAGAPALERLQHAE